MRYIWINCVKISVGCMSTDGAKRSRSKLFYIEICQKDYKCTQILKVHPNRSLMY